MPVLPHLMLTCRSTRASRPPPHAAARRSLVPPLTALLWAQVDEYVALLAATRPHLAEPITDGAPPLPTTTAPPIPDVPFTTLLSAHISEWQMRRQHIIYAIAPLPRPSSSSPHVKPEPETINPIA